MSRKPYPTDVSDWLGAISIACVSGLTIYTLPSGTGEYQQAPNHRYRATAKALQRRTFTGKQVHYLEFQVESTANQTVIWRAIILSCYD